MTEELFRALFDEVEIETVRANVLKHGRRIGGRAVRCHSPLTADVSLLPRRTDRPCSAARPALRHRKPWSSKGRHVSKLDAITAGPVEKKFMLH